jgi:cell division protein FtsA
MKKRRIATGIDLGTHHVKVVVVEEVPGEGGIVRRIIGTGLAESAGLRHGYVVDTEEAASAIRAAKRQAESVARVPIQNAFLAVGGISLEEHRASGEAIISRADQEITELDIEKTLEAARASIEAQFQNRVLLHDIPLEFRVDGVRALGDPMGMRGLRLEADYLFISCLKSHVEALTNAAEAADIDIVDRMASPLAGSYVTLSKDQKMKGCVLANIGAETVSIVVYDEGMPVSMKVFPIGSTSITDELALGFRVSLEDAERIKMGRLSGAMYPKRKIDEIVSSRFRAMFDLVDKHLKALGKRGNLPAGIILSGGGSGHGSVTDIARGTLSLPARPADLRVPPDSKIRDATWAVAYGLALWGLTGSTEAPRSRPLIKLGKSFGNFLKQFLP